MALEVILREEEHACFQTLNVSDVIGRMHLERGVAAHCRSEEGGCVTLKKKDKSEMKQNDEATAFFRSVNVLMKTHSVVSHPEHFLLQVKVCSSDGDADF